MAVGPPVAVGAALVRAQRVGRALGLKIILQNTAGDLIILMRKDIAARGSKPASRLITIIDAERPRGVETALRLRRRLVGHRKAAHVDIVD